MNVNLILSNVTRTQDFIISYKLLYDDVYQISYKTRKKSEIIVKEIVTKFDYILCEINSISLSTDLIKIYYKSEDKINFMTAFTTSLLRDNGYPVRVALTNDLTLSERFEFNTKGNLFFGRASLTIRSK